MRKKIAFTTFLMGMAVFAIAAIADLTGNWVGSLSMGDGNQITLTYNFKVEGDKLTGSVVSPQGEIPITNGKFIGSDFSFNLDVNGMSIANTGKYYGDSATISIDFQGNKLVSIIKRAK